MRDAVRSCHLKHGTVECVFCSRRTDPTTYSHRTWLNGPRRSLSFSYTSCQLGLPSLSAMASSTHSTSPPPPSNHKPRKRRSRVKSLPTLNANGQDRDDTTLKRCNSFPPVSKVSFISLIQVDQYLIYSTRQSTRTPTLHPFIMLHANILSCSNPNLPTPLEALLSLSPFQG